MRLATWTGTIALLALALIAYASATLGGDLYRTIAGLRTSDWERPQWTVSHTELEFVRFQLAVRGAQLPPPRDVPLEEVRLAFDMVYSRLETLLEGRVIETLRTLPEFASEARVLADFLYHWETTIGGSDATLRANLPDIEAAAATAYPAMRQMALIALTDWNTGTVMQRIYLRDLLLRLGLWLAFGYLLLALCFGCLVVLTRKLEHRRAELQTARDKAVEGERAKSRFLAVMSHEIRNPLNGLLGSLSLLADTPMRSDQRRAVGSMQTSGLLLLGFLNRVLDHSKEEAGLTVVRPLPIALESLILSVVDSLRDQATAKGLTLTVDTSAVAPFVVMADPVMFAKVLENLVVNSIKFTSEGTVSVDASACRTADDRLAVTLRVNDTGIGIAEDQTERIFEDFETSNDPSLATLAGSGLGLGIVRRIVRAMNGRVEVTSTLGVGSTFSLDLCFDIAESAAVGDGGRAEVTLPAAAKSPLRILCAEDIAFNRLVIEHMLRAEGHTVVTVDNGAEAVEACRTERFDVVLLDVLMPVMDGVDAAERIRKRQLQPAETLLCAVTALALPEEISRLRRSGFDQILAKPIDRARLRAILAEAPRHRTATNRPARRADVALT